MKRRYVRPASGYTIVEVIIFLAVSGMLFVSATTLISGQQRRTEFSNAVREFEIRLLDIVNDVETGYFPAGNYRCTAGISSSPVVTAAATGAQGTNDTCIFAGKAVQFSPAGSEQDKGRFNIYSLAGRRYKAPSTLSKEEVTNINEAWPDFIPVEEGDYLSSSIQFHKIVAKRLDGTSSSTGGFVVMPSFGQTVPAGGIALNGSSGISIANITGSRIGQPIPSFKNPNSIRASSVPEAAGGIIVCIRDRQGVTSGRRAAIILGAKTSSGTETIFDNNVNIRTPECNTP